MNILNFIEFLISIKKEDLLGFESHKKMVPFKLNPNTRDFQPKIDSKESAVLIILNQISNTNLQIIFTLRSSKLRKHSGQISFPGGRKDSGEEIGIYKDKLNILNEISPLYVPPSNSIVYPVISYSENLQNFKINYDEVDEIINIDFSHFLNINNLKFSKNLYNNQNEKFPYWDINHTSPLWGATAIILQELIDLYNISISK
jgi:hypothetical protein